MQYTKSNNIKGKDWWIALSKIKNFPLSKDTITIVKIQTIEWEDIFAIHNFEKVPMLNGNKDLLQIHMKKTTHFFKMGKILEYTQY